MTPLLSPAQMCIVDMVVCNLVSNKKKIFTPISKSVLIADILAEIENDGIDEGFSRAEYTNVINQVYTKLEFSLNQIL